MDKMKKFLGELFRKKDNRAADFHFIHEEFNILTLESLTSRIDHNDIITRVLTPMYNSYIDWKSSGFSMNSQVSFFDNDKSKGFAIHCKELEIDAKFYLSFIKYIVEKCKNIGYILKLSEVKSNHKQGTIEKIYKVYLKPSVRLSNGEKSVQLFGNISIELIALDGKNHLFRLLANTYQDHKFHPAKNFDIFIKGILRDENFDKE